MDMLNKLVTGLMPAVPKPIVGKISARYIAGVKLYDAVREIRTLNNKGACSTMDLLGEFSDDPKHAQEATETYIQMLNVIEQEGLDSNVSVKPSHLGLKIGYDFCRDNILRVVEVAAEKDSFVRIDMEDRTCTDDSLRMYFDIHEKHPQNVGLVIQAYLRRTIDDIEHLIDVKANLRLCKGIYVEPRKDAFKNRNIIIRNYAYLLEKLLAGGCYVGIATHCEEAIWHANKIIRELGLKHDQYEFQMLMGVEPELRQILIDAGHKLRVYVPFGEEWYPYCSRRLKENPKMAEHVMRDFLGMESADLRG